MLITGYPWLEQKLDCNDSQCSDGWEIAEFAEFAWEFGG